MYLALLLLQLSESDLDMNYSSGLCGGELTQANGHLSSPSYPKHYTPNEDCVYTISQPNGTFLKLMVQEFNLVDWHCSDFLEIRDGNSEESALIGKFCGENIPALIQTTQSKVWIR